MRTLLVLIVAVFVSTAAWAQTTLAGTVKDASGAVLPGVTVEASSPVLTGNHRTAITGGTGHYRLETWERAPTA
jgi:hypothetical protein